MPIQHIEVLRNGTDEEELKVVETAGLPTWGVGAELSLVGRPHTRL